MKKTYSVIVVLSLLLVAAAFISGKKSFAASSNAVNAQAGQQIGTASPSPIGNQVRNQVSTQNQGEETNLQVSTMEQEGTEAGEKAGLLSNNPAMVENMSTVAVKVQELLQIKTTGGIGDQVKQIARDQDQAQLKIQDQIDKAESKGNLAKTLFGPDYKAIKNLQQELEQNRIRIQQLQQLQTQLSNQGDKTAIQEMIKSLTQENTFLQDMISLEEQTKSLFGWLVKLFAK